MPLIASEVAGMSSFPKVRLRFHTRQPEQHRLPTSVCNVFLLFTQLHNTI